MATLEDLEARIAALEASQADYRAVLAAINALGANQRDHAERLSGVNSKVDHIATKSDDTNARVRSLEDGQAEIKDLLLRALDDRNKG
ncbi:hypothetical protein [Mycolicibacterium fortuitum]|uniref:hypothetical protein n=1 Tax=Mycolicibacterium fortuitum TaxID=1766 RepID=UPI0007EAF436|nr:hypothetical protein [Mycolicibacterium fortuitum]MDG5773748.1 hypothetical protein [Mycolicibacterium fortuitum]MDV7195854.1 hypothetical protein [Mycolicibacterium fortuitum]NOQ62681.1 hypothetical protein [Mycolicibacterium fortuitum]OBB49105.1 hypothetical protein A5754_31625 [Mycolicibacterium fortuitum]OBB81083.1 hypothetical protein A5755_00205 [Mycolicibacterium fortuitum]